jgi:hypothetical protein
MNTLTDLLTTFTPTAMIFLLLIIAAIFPVMALLFFFAPSREIKRPAKSGGCGGGSDTPIVVEYVFFMGKKYPEAIAVGGSGGGNGLPVPGQIVRGGSGGVAVITKPEETL